MAGTQVGPVSWPVVCTQGDTLPVETRSVARVVAGVSTAATLTSAVAQVRQRRDRDSTLVVDLSASVSGDEVSWGGVAVPLTPGSWWWDLQVTGTFGATAFDLTVLAGSFVIGRDVSDV